MSSNIKIGTFNILSKGLGRGEFLSQGGDEISVSWDLRAPRIINVLSEMFKTCDVIVTQENDDFFGLLNGIRSLTGSNIRGILCLKTNMTNGIINATNARTFQTRFMYNELIKLLGAMADSKDKYSELNEMNKKINKFQTFEQACGIYGKAFAEFYSRSSDDVFVSDDGVGIYYNADKLSLNENTTLETTNILDIPIVLNKDGWIKATFSDIHTRKNITIFGAHLPSGETYQDELKRLPILDRILSEAEKSSNPFIVMDSNNSVLYEQEYFRTMATPSTMSSLIKKYGFNDGVAEYGYECFKMRHNMGGQPKKYCLLMFDTIDKILYKSARIVDGESNRHEFGFVKYDPEDFDTIYEIRTNPTKRTSFENMCLRSAKTDKSEVMFKDLKPFLGLYPNINACSDHPPIAVKFIF